ncbi:MAG TPA: hypothetical protein DCS93_10580 [Microscillaceae bacterium]|nr:hypothetical protein [Microscillaceae bacterium]
MKTKPLLFISVFCCFYHFGWSQETTQALAIKQEIIKAFGGKKALRSVKTFAYTLQKGVPEKPKTTEKWVLDFAQNRIEKRMTKDGQTIIQRYENGQGWEVKSSKQSKLDTKATKRLTNNFFYNFIGMLQDDSIRWEFIKNTIYRKQKVRIVRVSNTVHRLDLFVNKQGEIVTSSTPDSTGKYSYFADEFEYKPVGQRIRFPLVFRVFEANKCTYEGVFSNVLINQ